MKAFAHPTGITAGCQREQLDGTPQGQVGKFRQHPGGLRRFERGLTLPTESNANRQLTGLVRVCAPFRFTPLLADAVRPCRHAVGDRWQADETYVKVAGRWRYVYRAIDQFSQVIDVFVSPRRDVKAARRFFDRAIGTTKRRPVEVITDKAAAYPAMLEEQLPAPGIAPIGMPTTTSRPTTVVSRRGWVRCVGSSRTAAPGS
jgi:transposase InsO family protein